MLFLFNTFPGVNISILKKLISSWPGQGIGWTVSSEGESRTQEALALDLIFRFSWTLRQTWTLALTLLWADLQLHSPAMHILGATPTPQNSRWGCMDESLTTVTSALSRRRSYGTGISAYGGHRRQLPSTDQGKRLRWYQTPCFWTCSL